MSADLDQRLLAAHSAGHAEDLVPLYREAGARSSDETAKGFYLTHAYVYALETNHPAAARLRAQLVGMGRETP